MAVKLYRTGLQDIAIQGRVRLRRNQFHLSRRGIISLKWVSVLLCGQTGKKVTLVNNLKILSIIHVKTHCAEEWFFGYKYLMPGGQESVF